MKLLAIAAAALCALVYSGSAQAATMTFTGLPSYNPTNEPWVEDGITATGNGDNFGNLASTTPDTAHMDPPGWAPYASSITFTMSSYFNADSIDIINAFSISCTDPAHCYDNIRFDGLRNGNLIAGTQFFTGDLSSGHYIFSTAFSVLDTLVVSALYPVDNPCFQCLHFNIDNVTLTPIPLPAALPLFLSALAGLGWVGMRRSQKRALA